MNKEKDTKKEITLDDLAIMIANRFDEVDKKIDDKFNEVKSELNVVKDELNVVKDELNVVKSDLKEVKSTVGNIEATLNKKVDKIEHNTLTYRVEKLEEKFA